MHTSSYKYECMHAQVENYKWRFENDWAESYITGEKSHDKCGDVLHVLWHSPEQDMLHYCSLLDAWMRRIQINPCFEWVSFT